MQWKDQLRLLNHNPNFPQESYTIYLKNQRILKRLAVKINKTKFPKLQDSLLLCAIAVEERMPIVEQSDSSVPFPDSGADVLVELVQNIKL